MQGINRNDDKHPDRAQQNARGIQIPDADVGTDDQGPGVPGIEVPLREDAPLTPTTPEQLLDNAWDRLDDTYGNLKPEKGAELRYVRRDQLAEFMTEAALMAIGASGLDGPVEPTGSVLALLQSLRCVRDAAKDDHGGWSVVSDRAAACIDRLVKDVTRFLTYPGLTVRHHTLDHDLSIQGVGFSDSGVARVSCRVPGDDVRQWVFNLSEVNAAGVVDDVTRILVGGMARAMVEDTVAALIAQGQLSSMAEVAGVEPVAWLYRCDGGLTDGQLITCGKDTPGAFPVFGKPPEDQQLQDERDHNGGYTLAEEAAQEREDGHLPVHCNGCDIPEADRINLPEGWKPGDIVRSGLTIHGCIGDLRRFVFVGDPAKQDRHYFDGSYPKQAEVHHLQAHPEYVMEPGSPITMPVGVEPPPQDMAYGAPAGDDDPAQRV